MKQNKRVSMGIVVLTLCVTGFAVQSGCVAHPVDHAQEIQQNIQTLEALEQQTPMQVERESQTDAQVETEQPDVEAEQEKILALDAASVDEAKLVQAFRNAAIVGDSITAGCTEYGYLNDSIVFAKIGVSVSTAAELFQAVQAAAPSTAFLCFGVNDIEAYGSDAERFIDHYTQRIQTLQQALPDTALYVQALLPPDESVTKSFYQYRDTYNQALQDMCRALDIQYVDPSFLLENKPELYDADGVHPKKAFYPLWLMYLADMAGLSYEA